MGNNVCDIRVPEQLGKRQGRKGLLRFEKSAQLAVGLHKKPVISGEQPEADIGRACPCQSFRQFFEIVHEVLPSHVSAKNIGRP